MRSYQPAALTLLCSSVRLSGVLYLFVAALPLLFAESTNADVPPTDIKISVSPTVVQAANGKLPTSIPLAVSSNSCKDSDNLSGYSLKIAAAGLSITSASAGKCIITATLNIEPNAPAGKYRIILFDPKTGTPLGSSDFAVLEANAGPIPNGLSPQVDVLWEILAQKVCNDVFGKRVAENFYCVEVKVGNNTGHPLQLAGVGFAPHLDKLGIDNPNVLLANTSYASTRAVLLRETVLSPRNIFYHSVQATGLVMAGFIPYFRAATATAHFATASAIVSGPLLQAINIAGPDRVVNQLNNLDDESFRDNQIIPNNTQIRTIVFLEKRAVTELLDGTDLLGSGVLKTTADQTVEKSVDNSRDNRERQQKKKQNTKQLFSTEEENEIKRTRMNSEQTDKGKFGFFKGGDFSPLLVKLALGNLVIVGDLIEYLQRIQIQGTSSGGSSALTLNPTRIDFGDQPVGATSNAQTITVTNTSAAAVSGITVNLSGPNQADFAQTNTCSSVAPGANCAISVTFTPSGQQARAAVLNVTYPGASPQSVSLSGSGTQGSLGVSFSPASLPVFSAQKVQNASQAQVITMTNTGANPITGLTIAINGLNSADFSQTNTCGASLASAAKCTVSVVFKPLATGPRAANLVVTYTSSASQQTPSFSLSGIGQ